MHFIIIIRLDSLVIVTKENYLERIELEEIVVEKNRKKVERNLSDRQIISLIAASKLLTIIQCEICTNNHYILISFDSNSAYIHRYLTITDKILNISFKICI